MGVHEEELNESAQNLKPKSNPERTSLKTLLYQLHLLPPTQGHHANTIVATHCQAAGDTAHGGTTHDGIGSHLRHHNIMCVHQSRSKRHHARGKAANGDGGHSQQVSDADIDAARHCPCCVEVPSLFLHD